MCSLDTRDNALFPMIFDDRIVINVSGMIFETRKGTLARFPNSLLGSPGKRNTYYVPEYNEYFFNRNRAAFEAILYYYQSPGRLQRPAEIPMRVFKQEIEFFELGEDILHTMLVKEGYIEVDTNPKLPKNTCQRRVWQFFEHPDSSPIAIALVFFSIFMIVSAVIASIAESCVKEADAIQTQTHSRSVNQTSGATPRTLSDPWFVLEVIFNSWFTFEYVVRLSASPDKYRFMAGLLNIVDLIAILPFYITLALDSSRTNSVTVLRVLRIIRIFRMFKLSRYSRSLQVIGYCVLESIRELCLLVLCLFFTVVVSSTLLYYAEIGNKKSYFTSVPATFWFSIQTVTTIGYGDMVPVTTLGKFMSAACAIFGAITLALPVLTFVSNFNKLYYKNMEDNFLGERPAPSARTSNAGDNETITSTLDLNK